MRAVISGYATIDFTAGSPAAPAGAGTYLARISPRPRAGGAPLYAGRRLAANGVRTAPLVGIGDDPGAKTYCEACAEARVSLEGVETVTGGRTPACIMVHHENGGCTAFLDPGDVDGAGLSPAQGEALDRAGLVVIAAGPSALSAAVLARTKPGQTLAWIAKADAHCFPWALKTRIGARADFIFRNLGERGFVEEALAAGRRPGLVLVETRGGDGVRIETAGASAHYPVSRIEGVEDATGAGDTFAGEFLAMVLTGGSRRAAVEAAMAATSQFLLGRRAP